MGQRPTFIFFLSHLDLAELGQHPALLASTSSSQQPPRMLTDALPLIPPPCLFLFTSFLSQPTPLLLPLPSLCYLHTHTEETYNTEEKQPSLFPINPISFQNCSPSLLCASTFSSTLAKTTPASPFLVLSRTLFKETVLHGHRCSTPMKEAIPIQILAPDDTPPCCSSIQRRNVFRRSHAKNFTCPSTLFIQFITPFRQIWWASIKFLLHAYLSSLSVSLRHHDSTYLCRWPRVSKTEFDLMASACLFIFCPSNDLVVNIWNVSCGCRNLVVELDCW